MTKIKIKQSDGSYDEITIVPQIIKDFIFNTYQGTVTQAQYDAATDYIDSYRLVDLIGSFPDNQIGCFFKSAGVSKSSTSFNVSINLEYPGAVGYSFNYIVNQDLSVQEVGTTMMSITADNDSMTLSSIAPSKSKDFELVYSGDGNQFLSNDGQYKTVESVPQLVKDFIEATVRQSSGTQYVTQEMYDAVVEYVSTDDVSAATLGPIYYKDVDNYTMLLRIFSSYELSSDSTGIRLNCYIHGGSPTTIVYKYHVNQDLTINESKSGTNYFDVVNKSGDLYISTNVPQNNSDSSTNISISLKKTGDGSKYLSDDGTYSEIPSGTTYTFANGTNGFTVTPSGGTAQTVTVTPSIAAASTSTAGLMSASDKSKLNGLSNYSLPAASSSTRGGVKIWTGTQSSYNAISSKDSGTLYFITG